MGTKKLVNNIDTECCIDCTALCMHVVHPPSTDVTHLELTNVSTKLLDPVYYIHV